MFVMQWAKLFGAKQAVVFDIANERLGATGGINTFEDGFMDKAKEMTGGRGFDYVFETAGNKTTMKMAFELAANKAHVCFAGTPARDLSFTVDEWENMNRKEFTLTGLWMSYSAPFPGKEWELVAHRRQRIRWPLPNRRISRTLSTPVSVCSGRPVWKTAGKTCLQ